MLHILLFLSFFKLHDAHISVCDIIFNEKTGSIEIIHAVMIDDFENALKKVPGQKNIDLLLPETYESNDETIKQYFEEHFKLYRSGEQLEFTWIGYEVVDAHLRAYFEFENIRNPEGLILNSKILTKEHRKQQNMIHWKFGEKLQTAILSRNKSNLELTVE